MEEQFTNKVTIKNISNFALAETLDCGQAFRWRENPDGSFTGVAHAKAVTLSLEGSDLTISGITEDEYKQTWEKYFDLSRDYGAIKDSLSALHPTMKEAAAFAPGIRILDQEPWEALCSFIISQNNNIPRIKLIIDRLCSEFGDEIGDALYTFPSADTIASMTAEQLAPIRAGFRARYIIDAAKKVSSGEILLEQLRTAPIDDARAELMKITGVGIKVANCTLLYGLHRLDCFPMDVWMKRAMAVLFPELTPEDFGQYGGIAQQYIFHYSRMHPELFE